uniref:Glycosyltransferase n=1 Tax=viral metagenome TaxID=1070528 RepID=A0A6C0LTU8_9ZZZZ
MDNLSSEDLDKYLLDQDGKIIHQIWFGIIPNKHKARKDFEGLKKYRDSWLRNNPTWGYKCWDNKDCRNLMKTYFPEHLEMYDGYEYHIQRCDCIRYFILFRYGGLYADMDYCCMKPWDDVISKYKSKLYIVETPNKVSSGVHISNSLMYSIKNHPFWKSVFIEMEKNRSMPIYYGKHMTVMYTTGPCIINRMFHRYRNQYKLSFYPYKLFHPFGVTTDLHITNDTDLYAYHLQHGSWTSTDSNLINFVYKETKIVMFILIMVICRYIII